MTPNRRTLLSGGAALLSSLTLTPPVAARQGAPEIKLSGKLIQGGFAIGRTEPGAPVALDGKVMTQALRTGLFVIGFDRDAPPTTIVSADRVAGASANGRATRGASRTLDIARGDFPSSRIDGLPPSTVEPSDPELLARIQRELAAKTAAFQSCADTEDFADGFVWPLEAYRISSLWGAQRVLNGTPARPHYGIDLAAPAGTPIHAPAAGLVIFAEPDMHFEGGLVLIDHGQGLITAYLHQSELAVTPGQRLDRGGLIGKVGMKGRATGPHLCWRMKWRDRYLDPSLMIGAAAPT